MKVNELSTKDIKPECIEKDPFKLHLTDFRNHEYMSLYNNIVFIDDNGHNHHLKTRGCVKKRKYRRVKRRKLKFKNS